MKYISRTKKVNFFNKINGKESIKENQNEYDNENQNITNVARYCFNLSHMSIVHNGTMKYFCV